MNYDLSHVLEFFAASVGSVLGNLAARLLNAVEIPEMDFLAKLLRTFFLLFQNLVTGVFMLYLYLYRILVIILASRCLSCFDGQV